MKIGIVGGTGDIGEGLAMRLSPFCEVILGSRDKEKACSASECTLEALKERGIIGCCWGVGNQEAVDQGEVVILAVPFKHLVSTVTSLHGFEGKIVVSPVNPMGRDGAFYYDPPEEGSAALLLRKLLPGDTRIVSAFNNIAANKWKNLNEELEFSVAVCGDDPAAKEIVMGIVNRISRLKAYDAGPLAVSSLVESITPLLLNIARFNKMRDVGIEFR